MDTNLQMSYKSYQHFYINTSWCLLEMDGIGVALELGERAAKTETTVLKKSLKLLDFLKNMIIWPQARTRTQGSCTEDKPSVHGTPTLPTDLITTPNYLTF